MTATELTTQANAISTQNGTTLPALIASADPRAQTRFVEFFTATIRNVNTRRAYVRATGQFLTWCEAHGITSLAAVQPLHVAAYIEEMSQARSAPTAKQALAAIRHLFDWLVTGQIVPVNPAASVRGPSHKVRSGKTPVLEPAEARTLLDAIDVTTMVGLRDRALIGLMVYSFSRIGAALSMKTYMRFDATYGDARRARPQNDVLPNCRVGCCLDAMIAAIPHHVSLDHGFRAIFVRVSRSPGSCFTLESCAGFEVSRFLFHSGSVSFPIVR